MRAAIGLAAALVGACESDALRAARMLETSDRANSAAGAELVAGFYGERGVVGAANIRWTAYPFELPGLGLVDGYTGTHVTVAGLRCEIWLALALAPEYDPYELADSSLAHELAHCALYLSSWDPDEDHEAVGWWEPTTGLVSRAQDAIRQSGLR